MINRIAAGEVVERPSSVVKELVENAIDADARRIEIATAGGGLTLIRVTDDGGGMDRADLALSVERHCTSKLTAGLRAIETLGFRGEALASIGAVARLRVASRRRGDEHGWQIAVEGGRASELAPAATNPGTQVEAADLFFATPARLKFMKTERAEAAAIVETVRQIAMAHPEIRFTLSGTDRTVIDFPAADPAIRIEQAIGREFRDNAVPIHAEREGARLSGFAALPTYNRGNSARQYFFVNGRAVRDKQLFGALRAAYADFVSRDRHPVAALFIDLAPAEVDVNVHPAKAEVRFRDPGKIRGLIVGAIKEVLASAGHRATSTGGEALRAAFRTGPALPGRPTAAPAWSSYGRPIEPPAGFAEPDQAVIADIGASADIRPSEPATGAAPHPSRPLGVPRAQLHENYIIAQTADGLVVVDQHAAHERLVYERLKAAIARRDVATQMLLVPEIAELPPDDVDRLLSRADELAVFGLTLEQFGPGAVAVREVPAMLDGVDIKGLVEDLAAEIAEMETATRLAERIDKVAGTIACHGSVRSGRRLRPEEMDALLRQMEAEPYSGQCIHGRPTYIELKLADLERLFGRR